MQHELKAAIALITVCLLIAGCSAAQREPATIEVELLTPEPTIQPLESEPTPDVQLESSAFPVYSAGPDSVALNTPIPEPEPTPTPEYIVEDMRPLAAYVKGNGINMREGPDLSFDIIGNYLLNQKAVVDGEYGEWYRVKIESKKGFMHKDFIALGDPPKPTPTQRPKPTNAPKPTTNPDRFTEKEVYLAAQLTQLENRGGSLKGYKAVVSVVLNRLSHIHFPDTIRGVIYQNNQFTVVDSIPGTTPCNNALKAAREVLNGSGSTLPSDVVFFRAASLGTDWGNDKKYYCTIDNNAYFRWIG